MMAGRDYFASSGHPGTRSSCYVISLLILMFTGCASLPENYPRNETMAIQNYLDTSIGRLLETKAREHPGLSGFSIIKAGRDAFTARVSISDLAEKSLDLQYYLWEADATGKILTDRLIRAADRGVRVRILVDDMTTSGHDARIATAAAHPNIEIRIFNPFVNRRAVFLDVLGDFNRINHRMHNKIMIVDNALAIVGGRNIGDIYFQVANDANYRDLDMAATEPVVRDISDVFDHFWNGPWAVPIEALVKHSFTMDDLQEALVELRRQIAEENDYPYPLDSSIGELRMALKALDDRLIWAPGWIVWDDPAAIKNGGQVRAILDGLERKLETLDKELLIESAYFVMQVPAQEALRELEERGIRVRVFTNSLASNDVIAAHAGHAAHRKQLIENGVELYEMRADAAEIQKSVLSGQSKASLHSKAMVFDGDSVFIGSFNLDPRSAKINTETALYVESPELAEQLIAYMDEGVRKENSYQVVLNEGGDLVWVTEIDGEEVRLTKEPGASFINSILTWIIQILPFEDQL